MLPAMFLLSILSAQAAEPKPLATLPLRLNQDHQMWIQVRLNGSEPIWCNLDSGGSDLVYLDIDRAAKLGILPTTSGRSSGSQDGAMARDSRARTTLEVGGLKFERQEILLQPRPWADFACGIGQTVLGKYIVEVDYQTATLALYDRAQFRYRGSGKVLPFTLYEASPLIEASLTTPNGKAFPARVVVDTGAVALVMFSKRFADENSLLKQGLSTKPEPMYGTEGQQVRVVSAQAAKFAVGPFEISDPVIHLQQFQGFGGTRGPDGLLGGEFLHRFRLIFDYQEKKLILEPVASLAL